MKPKRHNILKRVLIVDDDADIRLALRALLRDAGYEVVGEAPDGIKAMALVEKHKPAIVLLDICMPGTSGLDVMLEIKETLPLTKVVMISGDATSEHVTTAMERGASGFIVKPFNFNNVIKNLERALIDAAKAMKNAKPEEINKPGLLEQNEQAKAEDSGIEESSAPEENSEKAKNAKASEAD